MPRPYLALLFLLTLFAVAALGADDDCECFGSFKSLAAERAALPAVYDQIIGLSSAHSAGYHRARLAALEARAAEWTVTDAEQAAASASALGDDARAIELLTAAIAAHGATPARQAQLGRYLARRGQWTEAATELAAAAAAEPTRAVWAWQAHAAAAGPTLTAREPSRYLFGLLGIEVERILGPRFRVQPPVIVAELGRETSLEANLWQRLNLPAAPFEGLLGVFELTRDDEPEAYYALAELLAAASFRRLAWHAYQRAWDLEHPDSVNIAGYQAQVAEALPAAHQWDLTPARHYRLRRAALAWSKARAVYEDKLVAEGTSTDDAGVLAPFYEEHPKP